MVIIRKFSFDNRDIEKQFYDEEIKQLEKIYNVLGEADLTEAEKRILKWIVGWDKSTVDNFISIIEKAVQSGMEKQKIYQRETVKKKSKCR